MNTGRQEKVWPTMYIYKTENIKVTEEPNYTKYFYTQTQLPKYNI